MRKDFTSKLLLLTLTTAILPTVAADDGALLAQIRKLSTRRDYAGIYRSLSGSKSLQTSEELLVEFMTAANGTGHFAACSSSAEAFLSTHLPKADRFWHQLARAYVGQGRLQDAAGCFRRLLADNPNDITVLFALAGVHNGNKDYREYEKTLEKILSLEPRHLDALRSLGFLHSKRGHQRQALQCFKQLASLKPNDIEAELMIAGLEQQPGNERLHKAIQLVLSSSRHGACGRAIPYSLLIGSLNLLPEPERLAQWQLLAAAAPGDPVFSGQAASQLLAFGRADEALEVADRLLAAAPDAAGSHLLRGELNLRLGHPQAALEDLQKAARATRQRSLLYAIGAAGAEAYREIGNQRSAALENAKIARLTGTPVELADWKEEFFSKSYLYGALAAVSALIDSSERRDAKDLYFWRHRVWRCLQKQESDLADLDRAIAISPEPDYLLTRADLYHRQRRLDKALADIDRCCRLRPSAYVYELAARMYVDARDYPRAIARLTRALELAPTSTAVLCLRAHTYMKMDDSRSALKDLNQALHLDQNCGMAYAIRGVVHRFLLHDAEAARADWQRARSLKVSSDQQFW